MIRQILPSLSQDVTEFSSCRTLGKNPEKEQKQKKNKINVSVTRDGKKKTGKIHSDRIQTNPMKNFPTGTLWGNPENPISSCLSTSMGGLERLKGAASDKAAPAENSRALRVALPLLLLLRLAQPQHNRRVEPGAWSNK